MIPAGQHPLTDASIRCEVSFDVRGELHSVSTMLVPVSPMHEWIGLGSGDP